MRISGFLQLWWWRHTLSTPVKNYQMSARHISHAISARFMSHAIPNGTKWHFDSQNVWINSHCSFKTSLSKGIKGIGKMINKKIISENKFQFSGPANLEMYDRRHSDETGRDSWETNLARFLGKVNSVANLLISCVKGRNTCRSSNRRQKKTRITIWPNIKSGKHRYWMKFAFYCAFVEW